MTLRFVRGLMVFGGGFSFEWEDDVASSVRYRMGPRRGSSWIGSMFKARKKNRDQCVFLLRYRVKVRGLWIPMKIRAGGGPHRLPDSEREDQSYLGFDARDESVQGNSDREEMAVCLPFFSWCGSCDILIIIIFAGIFGCSERGVELRSSTA